MAHILKKMVGFILLFVTIGLSGVASIVHLIPPIF